MIVLALDLATKTGFAVGDIANGDKPYSSVHKLPSTGDDIGKFLFALVA